MIYETISQRELNANLPLSRTHVTLTAYARPHTGAPASDGNRWAVLILPGGGYQVHGEMEGEPVALAFLSMGVQAFVLNYSLAPDRHPQPLLDAAAAIAYIRAHREKYGISRIAVCGFSAGGHLAGSLANLWHLPILQETLRLPAQSFRPDAAILGYPVIQYMPGNRSFLNLLGKEGVDTQPGSEDACLVLDTSVTPDNPPTFLWATVTDELVPVTNTLAYAHALLGQGVSVELHLFPKGPHAMSLADREVSCQDSHVAMWMQLCRQWLDALR